MRKIVVLVSILLIVGFAWLGYQYWLKVELEKDPKLTWLDPGIPLKPIQLQDMHGQTFDLNRLRGQWSIIFFGYTSCPDICPTTMLMLKQLMTELRDQYPTQVILISVDPDRDSREKLAKYIKFYSSSFLAVRGKVDNLQVLLNQFGAYYEIEDKAGNDYHVSHTASLFIIHPDGKLVAALRAPHDINSISQSYRKLRGYYGS